MKDILYIFFKTPGIYSKDYILVLLLEDVLWNKNKIIPNMRFINICDNPLNPKSHVLKVLRVYDDIAVAVTLLYFLFLF